MSLRVMLERLFLYGNHLISTKVSSRDFTPLQILFTWFMIGYLALWAVAQG